jgi:hypothetical protein
MNVDMTQNINDFRRRIGLLLRYNAAVTLDVTQRVIPPLGPGDEKKLEITYSPGVCSPFQEYVLMEGETQQQILERKIKDFAEDISKAGLEVIVEVNGNYRLVVQKKT